MHGASRGAADDTSWGATTLALGEYEPKGICGQIGYYAGTTASFAAGFYYGASEVKAARYITQLFRRAMQKAPTQSLKAINTAKTVSKIEAQVSTDLVKKSFNSSHILSKGTHEITSTYQANLLKIHLTQLEKYGTQGFRQLENKSIRYYGELKNPMKAGEMIGRRRVREWNPDTGVKRTWHETLDGSNNVRIVRPETNNGIKTHYVFDMEGNFTGVW